VGTEADGDGDEGGDEGGMNLGGDSHPATTKAIATAADASRASFTPRSDQSGAVHAVPPS
jgi:hypothetical protein